MLVFKNADVARKYESDFDHDPIVHVPGGTNKDGWKGKLSAIPMYAADKLIIQKSNLVRPKENGKKSEPLK
jgi:hypothetical protein